MGQITTKIYEKACVYDFSVDGGAIGLINMGISINGGETIIAIRYNVISSLLTAALTVDAGFGFLAGVGFVNPANTVAALNAAVNSWFIFPLTAPLKVSIGSVSDTNIYFNNSALMTGGVMLFSFDIMSHPL